MVLKPGCHGNSKLTKESENANLYIYPNLWTGDKPSVELRRKISPHHKTGFEYIQGVNNINANNKPSPSNRVAIRKKPYYGAVKKRTRIYTSTRLTATSNYNILIVDDNPINLNILKKCLQLLLAGHIDRLELASDGVKALEKLNARPFDLVLLDIDMPVLNGLETTRYIRHSSEEYSVLVQNRTIPIVAVTTNDSEDSKNTYFQIGMNDCISKPIQLHLLEEALSNVLMLSL
ncbi:hypothetical protein K501DRAFT_333051 [Backusella circina FSU 941]|nr:hypothetical protein K501DRAFT_333051 [Backusella circina FSU 941]